MQSISESGGFPLISGREGGVTGNQFWLDQNLGGVQILPNFVQKVVQMYQKQPKLAFDSLFHSENTQIYRAKRDNFALFEVSW